MVDEDQIASFLPTINKKLSWLSREDLIKHFVSVEFNRFLEYYKDAGDLNVIPEKGREEGKKKKGKVKFTRMYINLGKKHGMNASHLIGLVNEALRRNDMEIGKIDVQRNFSFFEIDRDFDQETLKAFENTMYEDIPINVDISEGDVKGERPRPRNRPKERAKSKARKSKGKHPGKRRK